MRRAAALILTLALGAAVAAPAPAAAAAPWQAFDTIDHRLFDAQAELILTDPSVAARDVRAARAAYGGELRAALREHAPAADRAARRALGRARAAVAADDALALAAARGDLRGAVFRGSYAVTLAAVRAGEAETARAWLKLREFRTATRFTRPGVDATRAVQDLARGETTPREAALLVEKDLLDAYQARLREHLADADAATERGNAARRGEAAAHAAGSFAILADRYAEDRGAGAREQATAAFARLRAAAIADDDGAFAAARADVDAALEGFTAAPFTPEEAARRAQQLTRFLALVPVEYERGVDGDRVTLDFEIQEALAFAGGAQAAFGDLRDQLADRDAARTERIGTGLAELAAIVQRAAEQPTGVAGEDEVQARADRLEALLEATYPQAWKASTDDSDFDLIQITLDRMEAAIGAGQYGQAEQARLEAYAFFEFGPERRLQGFDPALTNEVEGLIWFGARGEEGLAQLIADHAARRDVRPTRLALDGALADAQATLGDATSRATVVTNAAIIVFREGLEAVLILAAITASFAGARRRERRPVLIGAGLGLLVSVVTWVAAQTLLGSLARYGEKLEAIVGLVAIGVLLLITNWFFHKVYWTGWISSFHKRRKRILQGDRFMFFSAQAVGLCLLGLTSVYREGFETVLFLQSLELSAGTVAVLEGTALGLALTLGVALLTFALQRKLPYKRMLIVTGVMIGAVLVMMVGQTVRTMQGTGWVPITPLDVDLPYWAGQWLGVYPTWETIGAQVAAMAFVIGSYFLAEEIRIKRPRRRARREAEREPLGQRAHP
ncbi:MAG TPA: FTR1 family protein [Capillimicrobium sp.]|nr:FTR1 family protein [Capillimicrobium sp.]